MLTALTKLIFPVECAGCEREGEWLCDYCQAALAVTPAGLCRICGRFGRDGICERCQEDTKLDGIVSLFPYRDQAIQSLIKTAKYAGAFEAIRWLAQRHRMKLLRALPDERWAVSYVPIEKGRLAKRGFNQAELIAQVIGGSDFPVQPLFKKVRATLPQAALDGKDRRSNLSRAFEIITDAPEKLVICDDVITTGTTLGRLAKLAKKRGAKTVWAVTLAHS